LLWGFFVGVDFLPVVLARKEAISTQEIEVLVY